MRWFLFCSICACWGKSFPFPKAAYRLGPYPCGGGRRETLPAAAAGAGCVADSCLTVFRTQGPAARNLGLSDKPQPRSKKTVYSDNSRTHPLPCSGLDHDHPPIHNRNPPWTEVSGRPLPEALKPDKLLEVSDLQSLGMFGRLGRVGVTGLWCL